MLAKKISKNQIALPKAIASRFPGVDYFEVREEGGRIVLVTLRESKTDDVRTCPQSVRDHGRRRRGQGSMDKAPAPLRAVLDTNVLFSALLFARGRASDDRLTCTWH